ncbi:MAG: hypothetical protein ACXWPM_12275 [Bdellovibrionota bacterium]
MNKLQRHIGWLAIPNIALILVTLQALGFLMIITDPVWFERLTLDPARVMAGEYWRLITFLAIPLSNSPLFLIFGLWFLYFLVNLIENEWGEFKTTFYILVSVILTIAFSFAFDYPVHQTSHFESTLFLAAAALYPDVEVRLFFAIPVKIKWLAWLTLGFLALELLRGDWTDRLYLVAIYSNYLIFFGPVFIANLKQRARRESYRRKVRR